MVEEQLEIFYYWMRERHSIWCRRTIGEPKPWTKDPILLDYKFCNVFRELDSVTVWLKKNIIEKWHSHPYLWFAFCVARRINLPATLEDLGDLLIQWDAWWAEEMLDSRKDRGLKIYNGAYMLTTGGRKVPKNHDTCHNILGVLWENREQITNFLERGIDQKSLTLQGCFNLFRTGHVGFSDFLAYEIVSDMSYSRYLENASDSLTWANAGPGASRGLNRLYGRELNSKIKPCQANEEMLYLLSEAGLYLDIPFPVEKLTMREIEHSLCEFDKYMRVKSDKGFLRQRYNGRS